MVERLQELLGVVGVTASALPSDRSCAAAPGRRATPTSALAVAALAQLAARGPRGRRAGRTSSPRLALGDDPAVVHDQQTVAQSGGLLHVVSRQEQGHPLAAQAVELAAEQSPVAPAGSARPWSRRGRSARSRFDERPGNEQPALDPPGQRLDPLPRPGRPSNANSNSSSARSRSRVGSRCRSSVPGRSRLSRMVRSPLRFVSGGRRRSSSLISRRCRLASSPQHTELAPLDRNEAVDHLHRRRLAGAVGAQESEADPRPNLEVDPVHGDPARCRSSSAPGQTAASSPDRRIRRSGSRRRARC